MNYLDFLSYDVMDWKMFLDKEFPSKLADMLNITDEYTDFLIEKYIHDKYSRAYSDLPTDRNDGFMPEGISRFNLDCDIKRYRLIKCSEQISNLFDHRKDYLKFTREEFIEYLNIPKDDLKTF